MTESSNPIEDQLKASTLVTTPEVVVCGVTLSCKLDMTEYARLEDYEKEHKLVDLRAKFGRFQRDIKTIERESYPPEYRALQKEIDDLEETQAEKLKERRENPAAWTRRDRMYMLQLEEAIASAQVELEAIPLDDATNIVRLDEMNKNLGIFGRHLTEFYLPFVHELATSRKLTKAKLETWQKQASQKDYENASRVVQTGKRLQASDSGLPPLPEAMSSKN